MEFKKGDIVTADFVVLQEVLCIEGQAWLHRVSDWKLVRQALDLSKPVRFTKNAAHKILGAMPSVDPDLAVVEIGDETGFVVAHRVKINDLENIPEDEL